MGPAESARDEVCGVLRVGQIAAEKRTLPAAATSPNWRPPAHSGSGAGRRFCSWSAGSHIGPIWASDTVRRKGSEGRSGWRPGRACNLPEHAATAFPWANSWIIRDARRQSSPTSSEAARGSEEGRHERAASFSHPRCSALSPPPPSLAARSRRSPLDSFRTLPRRPSLRIRASGRDAPAIDVAIAASALPHLIIVNGDYSKAAMSSPETLRAINWGLPRRLAAQAPVVLNLGNHENDFIEDPAVVVERRSSASPWSAISATRAMQALRGGESRLDVGGHKVAAVGIATPAIQTYAKARGRSSRLPIPRRGRRRTCLGFSPTRPFRWC